MKIKAINPQTDEFQEILLRPESGMSGECLIGRHPSCGLVLNSPDVSSIHGRIFFHNDQFCFTDLGSTNGSQIDNQEVPINQVQILKPDHLIRIGGFVLTVGESGANVDRLLPKTQDNLVGGISSTQTKEWSGNLTVRCIQVIDETLDVKTFRFVAEPSVLFTYKPGQFVTLDLQINGKRVKRSYSISSTPSRPQTLEITVKRVPPPVDTPDVPPGLVSNWLHDNVTVGSQIKLSAPMGKFTCSGNPAKKLLLISAGSGITPMMSMSRWICDTANDIDVTFVHSTRSSRDIIFREELELMAARHPNFKLAVTTTRPEPAEAWSGYTGRLNELMLKSIAPDFKDRAVYVCGPDSFMGGVKTMLEGLDFPMQNYSQESFGPPKKSKKSSKPQAKAKSTSVSLPLVPSTIFDQSLTNGHHTTASVIPLPTPPVTSTSSEPVVVFAKSGKEVSCDHEDSILEIAQQEGIELPYGCGMGACGQCKLRKLEGEVNYDEDPGCEQEYILTCIAKPAGRVAIEA
ncbi:MAG: FHA domain-containing protein [Symploca sp. SIO2E6]|nr:FHA domain-containing protein [Symploca sp. SIO2E6]